MGSLKTWLRGLPERHGRKTLILLAAILALGFGLRAYRVVEPLPTPGDDAHAYYALSKSLYTEGSFGGPDFEDPSDWSPGAPLLYAAAFFATGGAREGTARIVELLLGAGDDRRRLPPRPPHRRASRRAASPPSRSPSTRPSSTPSAPSYSEPPAMLTLPAAVLAFLWAWMPERPLRCWCRAEDSRGCRAPAMGRGRWLVPGLLFGLTAMFRPEYLLVGVAFVAARPDPGLARPRAGSRAWPAAALLVAALLLPIVPWTIRNQVVLAPHRADLDRRRQGALRRHLPARRRRIPAGQGDPRQALPAPRTTTRTPKRSKKSTRRRSSTASPTATRTCRATRRWARSASRTSPTTSAKTRSNTWR